VVSAHCQVTGARPSFGKSVSHSHRRTNRRWSPNIQHKTCFVPALGRNVTLTVSARGIKTIDRRGIDSVVAQIQARGERV
jgi:large subunit ribosomal protein L28